MKTKNKRRYSIGLDGRSILNGVGEVVMREMDEAMARGVCNLLNEGKIIIVKDGE